MKARNLVLLVVVMSTLFLSSLVAAADFVCERETGCYAYRFVDGEKITVKFPHNPIAPISSEAGWICHSREGWVEV